MANDVNHPEYYLKKVDDGILHPECIELLEFITNGYCGIAAGDIFQVKYAFRAGSKGDSEIGIEKKIIQEYKKLEWYINDFYNRSKKYKAPAIVIGDVNKACRTQLPFGFACGNTKSDIARMLVADQFAYDKPVEVRESIRELIYTLSMLRTEEDINKCKQLIAYIIKTEEEILCQKEKD